MLELGQPTHPYELDRLPGGGLGVRAARPGEALTTHDDVERRLGGGPSRDVLITDAAGTPVGIAGIMGGASSEIHEGTTRVLLEAAHFDRLTSGQDVEAPRRDQVFHAIPDMRVLLDNDLRFATQF